MPGPGPTPPTTSPIFQPTPKPTPDLVGEVLDDALQADEEHDEAGSYADDGEYDDDGEYEGDEGDRHSPGLEARLRSMDQHHWQDTTRANDQRSNSKDETLPSSRFNTAAKPFDFGGGGGGGGSGSGSGSGGGGADDLAAKLADTDKRLRSMQHHVDAADGLVMRLRQKLEHEQKLRSESERRERQLKQALAKLSKRNSGHGGGGGGNGQGQWQNQTADNGGWECGMCTLENEQANATCIACGHVRSPKGSDGPQKTVLGAMWFQPKNSRKGGAITKEEQQQLQEQQQQAAQGGPVPGGRPSFSTDVSDGGTSSSVHDHEGDMSCVVCLDADRNATLIHGTTGHSVVCLPCAQQLLVAEQPCPICQTEIDNVIETFSS